MIIWQGFGFLAVLIPVILVALLGRIDNLNSMTYGTETALGISAIAVWFAGKKLLR